MVSTRWLPIVLTGVLPIAAQMVNRPADPPLSADARPASNVPSATQKPLTAEVRADILMARKMYREAADLYSEGAANNAVLSNKLGIAYHQMLQFDAAKKNYQRAVKLNPRYAEAINNLGTVYYTEKRYRKAVGQYKKALKITPDSASIISNLGTAEFARKNYEEAMECYQRALELDPEVFERRSSNGVLLQERTIQEKAKFHYYMAKTYAKAGNTERALLYIRKSIEEGFKERGKFVEEPEFAVLRELPEFQELMKLEPRAL